MKKTFLAGAAILAVFAVSQAALCDAPTYTAQYSKSPIKVDGNLSDWGTAVKVPVNPDDAVVKEFGTVWDVVKATGDFRVTWDDNYLYWGFSIKDPQLVADADDANFWQNDCVSGFLYDENKETNIKFFTSPRQQAYTVTGVLGGAAELNEDIVTGVQTTKDGYDVEVAMPWKSISIGTPNANDTFAFTTLIIDKNDEWGQYMWVGDGDNAENFATLKLTK